MDIPYASDPAHAFVTNVGLITTTGPYGPDIMAAEWTHHVSYSPGRIAVCINPTHATHKNIQTTKEFGLHISASDQNVFVSVAGKSSGESVDKIKALKELGAKFISAKHIAAPMLEGTVLAVECKVVHEISLGDHTMFVGEALKVTIHREKTPLVYHRGKYWQFGEPMQKPPPEELERIKKLVEKYRKK